MRAGAYMQIYIRMWNTHLELGTIPNVFQRGQRKAGQSPLSFPGWLKGQNMKLTHVKVCKHHIFCPMGCPAQSLDGATSMKYLCHSPASAPSYPLHLGSYSRGAALLSGTWMLHSQVKKADFFYWNGRGFAPLPPDSAWSKFCNFSWDLL